MMKTMALLCLLIMPATAYGMANPWVEGSRDEIMAKAGFNPPLAPSIERCGKNAVWRYHQLDDLIEATCPRGNHAETKVRISRKQILPGHVMYSATSTDMYRGVTINLKRQTAMGNYVRAEFHVKAYNYAIDMLPGSDLEAMMHQVRSIIDKLSEY